MARKRSDFRPDNRETSLVSKLYLTKRQQQKFLRWLLYALVFLLALVLQDVFFCRLTFYGATTDLAPCVILMTCVMLGTETGCTYALAASLFYLFSGSAPGAYVIVLLTFLGVSAAAFRQGYLRKGFNSTFLCASVSMILYELALFATGLFLGYTISGRFSIFCMTGLITCVAMPILYPILNAIGKIGGETWKE